MAIQARVVDGSQQLITRGGIRRFECVIEVSDTDTGETILAGHRYGVELQAAALTRPKIQELVNARKTVLENEAASIQALTDADLASIT